MKYSFIKPRKKEILDSISKMWIGFIVFVVFFLFVFDALIKYKIDTLDTKREQNLVKIKNFKKKIKNFQKEILFLNKQKSIAEDIYASNTILKNSIKNLFDLVPDQITLKKVDMKKDSLTLYGVTPSKDIFNFLLGSPLKSIFQSSNTIFYLNRNGWYRFVSINKIVDKDEGL